MNDKEIIDLTSSEDHEVIVIESGDESEGSSPNGARQITLNGAGGGSSNQEEGENVAPNGIDDTQIKKKRKSRRAPRRRKKTIVGEEEGELIELDATEDSEQVSRADSRERTSIEESRKPQSAKSVADRNVRDLLDRLADADEPKHRNTELKYPDSEDERKASTRENKSRRKKKRRRDNKEHRESEVNGDNPMGSLFFVDEKPAEVPDTVKFDTPAVVLIASTEKVDQKDEDDKPSLILPWNVSVFEGTGDMPVETIFPPQIDSEDEDFIEYLNYDDGIKGRVVTRYFNNPAQTAEAHPTRTICKKCGEEGDHIAKDCPVMICLTCGARDEHSTRGCPISKTCYRCGMRGHLNRDCPNRYSVKGHDEYNDCDRCGSTFHQTSECPTLWRMYDYVDDMERLKILEDRENMRDLDIGEGGEGYIAPDDWCYNCGGCGHFGDDCKKSHPHEHPREPSAFSIYNINAGPFADAKQPDQRKPSRAAAYAAQAEKAWGDGYGSAIPLNVGKQAKKKEKARMERRAQEVQEDDGDDWFANRGGGRESKGGKSNGGTPKGPRNGRQNTKITFGSLGKDDDRYGGRDRRDRDRRDSGRRGDWDQRLRYDDLPGPSRETDSIQIRGAARKYDRNRDHDRDEWDGNIRGAASRKQSGYDGGDRDAPYEQRRKERSRNDDRYGDRDRRKERDSRGASPRREPRYRGGYSR